MNGRCNPVVYLAGASKKGALARLLSGAWRPGSMPTAQSGYAYWCGSAQDPPRFSPGQPSVVT